MNAIEFRKVSFAYPRQPIFRQLDLAIARGDFVAVSGGNGAGKSTFLKLCVSRLAAADGDILIDGEPVKTYRDWRKIGYVPQNPLHDRYFPITVAEVVTMGRVAGLGFGGRLQSADRIAVRKAMRLTGIDGLQSQMIGNLSGGQQQRVMLARALAAEPSLLILDEPTAGIDSKGATGFFQLLRNLNQDAKITVLLGPAGRIGSGIPDRPCQYCSPRYCRFPRRVRLSGPSLWPESDRDYGPRTRRRAWGGADGPNHPLCPRLRGQIHLF